jgi:hypothetical protein
MVPDNPNPENPKVMVQYPRGAIMRTWAFKYNRINDIKIEDVLQALTCKTAVLASFQWDDHWIFTKLNPIRSKQYWIMSGKGPGVQNEIMRQAKEANTPVTIHFPPMTGQTMNMHCKFMLLFHPSHLRIAIPTANLVPVDWGETPINRQTGKMEQPACIENSVFIVDLPRRASGDVGKKAELTEFGKEFLRMLEAMQVMGDLLEGILRFDFSATNDLRFVHSIGGVRPVSQCRQEPTGFYSLARAVRSLGLDKVTSMEIDYAASSFGALNDGFLRLLYASASGGSWEVQDLQKLGAEIRKRIRLYFPLEKTVLSSNGGAACGGTNTLRREDYNANAFPRECMRDYQSVRRPRILSHNKLLLVRGRRGPKKEPFAWAYVGSANLSESAWGKVVPGKETRFLCRNWECGVVMPVLEEDARKVQWMGDIPDIGILLYVLEVPFKTGNEFRYLGEKPWFFLEH